MTRMEAAASVIPPHVSKTPLLVIFAMYEHEDDVDDGNGVGDGGDDDAVVMLTTGMHPASRAGRWEQAENPEHYGVQGI